MRSGLGGGGRHVLLPPGPRAAGPAGAPNTAWAPSAAGSRLAGLPGRLPAESGRELHFSEHDALAFAPSTRAGCGDSPLTADRGQLGAPTSLTQDPFKSKGEHLEGKQFVSQPPPLRRFQWQSGRPGVSLVDEVRKSLAGTGLCGQKSLPHAWNNVQMWLICPLSGDRACGPSEPDWLPGPGHQVSGGVGGGSPGFGAIPREHLREAVCIPPQHLAGKWVRGGSLLDQNPGSQPLSLQLSENLSAFGLHVSVFPLPPSGPKRMIQL